MVVPLQPGEGLSDPVALQALTQPDADTCVVWATDSTGGWHRLDDLMVEATDRDDHRAGSALRLRMRDSTDAVSPDVRSSVLDRLERIVVVSEFERGAMGRWIHVVLVTGTNVDQQG